MAAAAGYGAASAPTAKAAENGGSGVELVDQWIDRYTHMKDLPPEGLTDEEAEKLPLLLAGVLKAQGRDAPIQEGSSWMAHFYLRSSLVRFLRGRQGDVDAAIEMLKNAMEWFESSNYIDNVLRQHAQSDSEDLKAVVKAYVAEGFFGVDRRGAPVLYSRPGVRDTAGLLREVGEDVYIRQQMFHLEARLDELYQASVKAGQIFIGFNMVIDCAEISMSRGRALVDFTSRLMELMLRDHFPEFSKHIFVVNAPYFIDVLWNIIWPVLPAATTKKVIFCSSAGLEELAPHIDIEQLPAFLGGKSPEPWPYGDGGDVPEGFACGKSDDNRDLHVATTEIVEIDVPAGKQCRWEYRVISNDIDVKIESKVDGSADSSTVAEVQRVCEEEGWQTGVLVASGESNRKVLVSFDNSFSWWNEKDVRYRIYVEDPPTLSEFLGDSST